MQYIYFKQLKTYSSFLIILLLSSCMNSDHLKTKYNINSYDPQTSALIVMQCQFERTKCTIEWKNLDTNKVATAYTQSYFYWDDQNVPFNGLMQVMVVKPGKYRFNSFYAYMNNTTYTYHNNSPSNIMEFEVMPGEIAYIGKLDVKLGSSLALYKAFNLKDDFNNIKYAFDNTYPELEGKLTKKLFRFSRGMRYIKAINSAVGIIEYKN